MDKEMEDKLTEFVQEIDEVITKYSVNFEPHNICGVLMSRFILMMSHDPETGKGLAKYIWERLDEIEQANPGNMI